MVSATSDIEALSRSPDDAVQRIGQSAKIILEVRIPRDAVLRTPSELSASEGAVLLPNEIKALPACPVEITPNRFKE